MSRTGLLSKTWGALKKSFVIARRPELFMGADINGNKFYEQPAGDREPHREKP